MINLLPQEYIRVQKNKTNKWIAIGVITMELSLAMLLAIEPLGEWRAKQMELKEVQERLESPQFVEVIAVQEQLKEVQEEYARWTNQIQEVSGGHFISGAMLDTLISNVPVGVSIDRLDLDEATSSIGIKGKSTNTFSLTGYVSKLQTIYPDAVLNFDIEEITVSQPYTSFSITIEKEAYDE